MDAILIPGGGLGPDGGPAPWVVARLDAALAVPSGCPILLLSSHSPHKPFSRHESIAGAEYLLSRGCAAGRLYLDTWSLDTIGNAVFARLMHCDLRCWRRLLIVTSEFHMPRTEAIFRWIFSLPPLPYPFDLHFQAVPNIGLDTDTLSARREKESASLAKLPQLMENTANWPNLHEFLFQRHGAYRFPPSAQPSAPPWTSSY
jgi:hypothetical protein